MEIPTVWLQPWNLMSVLFLINRYSFFFSCVGQTVMLLLPGRTQSLYVDKIIVLVWMCLVNTCFVTRSCHEFFYAPLTFQTIASICTSCEYRVFYALVWQCLRSFSTRSLRVSGVRFVRKIIGGTRRISGDYYRRTSAVYST